MSSAESSTLVQINKELWRKAELHFVDAQLDAREQVRQRRKRPRDDIEEHQAGTLMGKDDEALEVFAEAQRSQAEAAQLQIGMKEIVAAQ